MVGRGPAEQREMMRAWLVALVGAEGVEITLDEPADWTGWTRRAAPLRRHDVPVLRRRRRRAGRPVGRADHHRQWRCRACGSYFEALREEFDDPPAAGDVRTSRASP